MKKEDIEVVIRKDSRILHIRRMTVLHDNGNRVDRSMSDHLGFIRLLKMPDILQTADQNGNYSFDLPPRKNLGAIHEKGVIESLRYTDGWQYSPSVDLTFQEFHRLGRSNTIEEKAKKIYHKAE